jgi:atypical dual specificity phosphatase
MTQPTAFSWIERGSLAALGRPESVDELHWLKRQGIEVLVSLTEEPLIRRDVNEAGLMVYHVPIEDMTAPTQEELDRCVSAIGKARESGLGVGVHCTAGHGRTGTVLACWLVRQGESAEEAIRRLRRLRPKSIETDEQREAVAEFARRHQAVR